MYELWLERLGCGGVRMNLWGQSAKVVDQLDVVNRDIQRILEVLDLMVKREYMKSTYDTTEQKDGLATTTITCNCGRTHTLVHDWIPPDLV